MTENISPEKTIAEIVTKDYRASAVFEKYGIDFCCGGQTLLTEACAAKGIDVKIVIQELELATTDSVGSQHDYGSWDLSFLTDYIVNIHHTYLNKELDPICSYAHKIAEVHGGKHPELIKIAGIFDKIKSDMVKHLCEEEDILFPAIKRAEAFPRTSPESDSTDAHSIKKTLKKIYKEHDEIGAAVHKIRDLSSNYKVPQDACNTYMITFKKLKEFEEDLHKHVHLENNILFPKAEQL